MSDLEPQIVARVDGSTLSLRHFFENYAMKRVPVIITGAVTTMTSVPWTLAHLIATAGDCKVTLKRRVQVLMSVYHY